MTILNSWQWAFIGLALVAGIPLMLGPAITWRETKRLVKLLELLQEEGLRRGVWMDEGFQVVFRSIRSLAACAPLIASDGNKIVAAKSSPSDRTNVESFLEQNAWVLAYAMTGRMSFDILLSVARPWNLTLALRAAVAGVLLRLCKDRRGVLRIAQPPEATRLFVEKIDRQTKIPFDGGLKPA